MYLDMLFFQGESDILPVPSWTGIRVATGNKCRHRYMSLPSYFNIKLTENKTLQLTMMCFPFFDLTLTVEEALTRS